MPRLNELTNPEKWDDPEWMEVHKELETYSVDKHCFSETREYAYRKGWEWTQAIYGLHCLKAITPDAKALGVGAGREPVLFYLADRIGKVVGTDLYGNEEWSNKTWGKESDPRILEEVGKFCPRSFDKSKLGFLIMDGTKLDFKDESFDFTWSLSSIEHFGGHEAASRSMKEMARVTKKGGIVVIATEFIITPNSKDHIEFFTREVFEQYILRASHKLKLVQEMSYELPPLEYLIDPIMVHLGEDVHRRRHHIILNDGTFQWTSAMCFFHRV
jgi:SAM-dependent methyltransferase